MKLKIEGVGTIKPESLINFENTEFLFGVFVGIDANKNRIISPIDCSNKLAFRLLIHAAEIAASIHLGDLEKDLGCKPEPGKEAH